MEAPFDLFAVSTALLTVQTNRIKIYFDTNIAPEERHADGYIVAELLRLHQKELYDVIVNPRTLNYITAKLAEFEGKDTSAGDFVKHATMCPLLRDASVYQRWQLMSTLYRDDTIRAENKEPLLCYFGLYLYFTEERNDITDGAFLCKYSIAMVQYMLNQGWFSLTVYGYDITRGVPDTYDDAVAHVHSWPFTILSENNERCPVIHHSLLKECDINKLREPVNVPGQFRILARTVSENETKERSMAVAIRLHTNQPFALSTPVVGILPRCTVNGVSKLSLLWVSESTVIKLQQLLCYALIYATRICDDSVVAPDDISNMLDVVMWIVQLFAATGRWEGVEGLLQDIRRISEFALSLVRTARGGLLVKPLFQIIHETHDMQYRISHFCTIDTAPTLDHLVLFFCDNQAPICSDPDDINAMVTYLRLKHSDAAIYDNFVTRVSGWMDTLIAENRGRDLGKFMPAYMHFISNVLYKDIHKFISIDKVDAHAGIMLHMIRQLTELAKTLSSYSRSGIMVCHRDQMKRAISDTTYPLFVPTLLQAWCTYGMSPESITRRALQTHGLEDIGRLIVPTTIKEFAVMFRLVVTRVMPFAPTNVAWRGDRCNLYVLSSYLCLLTNWYTKRFAPDVEIPRDEVNLKTYTLYYITCLTDTFYAVLSEYPKSELRAEIYIRNVVQNVVNSIDMRRQYMISQPRECAAIASSTSHESSGPVKAVYMHSLYTKEEWNTLIRKTFSKFAACKDLVRESWVRSVFEQEIMLLVDSSASDRTIAVNVNRIEYGATTVVQNMKRRTSDGGGGGGGGAAYDRPLPLVEVDDEHGGAAGGIYDRSRNPRRPLVEVDGEQERNAAKKLRDGGAAAGGAAAAGGIYDRSRNPKRRESGGAGGGGAAPAAAGNGIDTGIDGGLAAISDAIESSSRRVHRRI